jgi:hypothetical protein
VCINVIVHVVLGLHEVYDGNTDATLLFSPMTPHCGQGCPETLFELIVEARVLDVKSADAWGLVTHIKTTLIRNKRCDNLHQVTFVRQ